jgi:hypothetical protein
MYRMDKCRGAQDVRERPRTADRVVNSWLGGRGELNKSITCIACHSRSLSKYAVFPRHARMDWHKSGTPWPHTYNTPRGESDGLLIGGGIRRQVRRTKLLISLIVAKNED